ncbi:DUF3313 domain-containing protein, partial [bacterium]|nr:DUF3313 domain-containing protein [bacterium]
PSADFAAYSAVMIDSVTIWQNEKTEKISKEDQQALTDYLYAALHEELSKDYRIVGAPGPGVMRLRAAITEAKGAMVVMNTITSAYPQARVLTSAAGMATDTALMVGAVGAEAEITDSMTGERLLAAVDERVGTKTLRGGLKKWSHVKRAFEYWADRVRTRLAELRAG